MSCIVQLGGLENFMLPIDGKLQILSQEQLEIAINAVHQFRNKKLICCYCNNFNLPTKKCLGCGAVAYCGSFCQIAHWEQQHKKDCLVLAKQQHKKDCLVLANKSMTESNSSSVAESNSSSDTDSDYSHSAALRESLQSCGYCHNSEVPLHNCKCGIVAYCGTDCKKAHKADHRLICKQIKKLTKGLIASV